MERSHALYGVQQVKIQRLISRLEAMQLFPVELSCVYFVTFSYHANSLHTFERDDCLSIDAQTKSHIVISNVGRHPHPNEIY
jgi:hypothetical protein